MRLTFTPESYLKLKYYTQAATGECSGMARSIVTPDEILITDVWLFKQVSGQAHTMLDTAEMAKFQSNLIKKKEDTKNVNVWWHSHGNMAAFFSGTDTGTIEEHNNVPYLISLVTSKSHEWKARFDLFSPIRITVDLVLDYDIDDYNIREACQKEVDEKVSKPKIIGRHGYGRTGFGMDPDDELQDYRGDYSQEQLPIIHVPSTEEKNDPNLLEPGDPGYEDEELPEKVVAQVGNKSNRYWRKKFKRLSKKGFLAVRK